MVNMTRLAALLILPLLSWQRGAGTFLTMQNDTKKHFLKEGSSITLECNFHASNYNFFHSPVLWTKQQMHEITPITHAGNINEPFSLKNSRFEVSYSDHGSKHHVELSILDVTVLDSGNYTCEVRGAKYVKLGHVTHYVYVRASIKDLLIIYNKQPITSLTTDSTIIEVIEGQAIHLECIAIGGFPAPKLQILVGKRNIDGFFQLRSTTLMSKSVGMRLITHTTQKWTDQLVLSRDDDGLRLKCLAVIASVGTVIRFVRLNILYAPKTTCADVYAVVDDKNIELVCNVSAKPAVESFKWVISSLKGGNRHGSELFLMPGESTPLYSAYVKEIDQGMTESILRIHTLTQTSFHTYKLVSTNALSSVTSFVSLYQRKSPNYTSDSMSQNYNKNKNHDNNNNNNFKNTFSISHDNTDQSHKQRHVNKNNDKSKNNIIINISSNNYTNINRENYDHESLTKKKKKKNYNLYHKEKYSSGSDAGGDVGGGCGSSDGGSSESGSGSGDWLTKLTKRQFSLGCSDSKKRLSEEYNNSTNSHNLDSIPKFNKESFNLKSRTSLKKTNLKYEDLKSRGIKSKSSRKASYLSNPFYPFSSSSFLFFHLFNSISQF